MCRGIHAPIVLRVAATYTPQNIVDAIDDAVYALTVSGAQSYSLHGRMVTKLDLAELRRTREYYQQLVNAGTSTRYDTVAAFQRPT